ncbi:EAL and HDOD domain-containing protein [Anaeroselena agilis]|uniref:HDOD domain-containing protein n=1 Tax=Anaeroselena agilis TaxID=3063788 RepID=A0ABU3NZG8_9FIRM|nr:HDOD domain-containing protein [Selenomonadales bacterium 4137-cl]
MNVFIARQPIFDVNEKVVAYELLFRGADQDSYNAADGDQATRDVIVNSLLVFGLDRLTGHKRAFVNFTENMLKSEVTASIPKELVTVEVLENIFPDRDVVAVCENLKKSGYQLALDDFIFRPAYRPLLSLADVVKVDFRQTVGIDRLRVINKVSQPDVVFLAEKVETRKEFLEARKFGYSLFQGYFFSRPEILSRRDIPGRGAHYLHIINEVNGPDLDFGKLESVVSRDVAFSYKLLKFINSGFFNFSGEIKSIRQALVLLGQKEIVRWVTLLALREYDQDRPEEIIKASVVRARFGELLAAKTCLDPSCSDVFFLGMFSLIDALTGCPLEEMLAELPLSAAIKNALLDVGEKNCLHYLYQCILAYERGEWARIPALLAMLGIDERDVPTAYVSAVEWADSLVY